MKRKDIFDLFISNGIEILKTGNLKLKEEFIENNKELVDEFMKRDAFVIKMDNIIKTYESLHHHDNYEILYIKKGESRFYVDEKIYDVKSGDILLITPNTLHKLEMNDDNENERIIISFSERWLDKLSTANTSFSDLFTRIEETKNYLTRLSDESKVKIEFHLNKLLKYQFSDVYGEDLLFNANFAMMLIEIYHIINNQEVTEYVYENKLVTKCIDYVMNNLSKDISIEDVARITNVSASTISHTFKNTTGTSLHRYIIKKRLIEAKKLIRNNVDFINIYSMCGFNDYSSFFRTFKKEYGITPKEYKMRVR